MRIGIELLPDPAAAARRAAAFICAHAHQALRERGRCLLALSGGTTPLPMFAALAREQPGWDRIDLLQVDERAAPAGSPDRNWTHIGRELAAPAGLPAGRLHPMPVEGADLASAAAAYAATLADLAGTPPVLDLVHLGLGPDGHTASLFPGDPTPAIEDRWVAATPAHHGHRRMTLTLPVLAAARSVLWLVCGADKAAMLARLVAADPAIPAGRVAQARARIIADAAAGRLLGPALHGGTG